MNSMVKSLAALVFVAAFPVSAHAVPVVFSWGGEKVSKVEDFPDESEFRTPDGDHVDAGCKYKQVAVFFLPLWNYDKQWCGYVGKADEYVEMDRTELASLAQSAGIQLPEDPSVPIWDAIGGKCVLLLLILAYVGFKAFAAEDDEAEGEE